MQGQEPATGWLCSLKISTYRNPIYWNWYATRRRSALCNKPVFLHLEMLVLVICTLAPYLGSVQCPPGKDEKVPPGRTTLALRSSIMVCVLCGLSSGGEGVWAAFLTAVAGSGSQQLHHIHANRPFLKPILRAFFWRYRNWPSSLNAIHEIGRYIFTAMKEAEILCWHLSQPHSLSSKLTLY